MKQAAPMPGDYGYGDGTKQAAPMPGDYGKQAAPMPSDYGNTGYQQPPPAYSNNVGNGGVPLGIVAVTCKQCGTQCGVPDGAQSVSCPGCQAVHDSAGNVVINVTNNVHHHYAGQGGGGNAVAVSAAPAQSNSVPGFPVGPNNYSPNGVAYPAPVPIAGGPLSGYAPDKQAGLGHCCDLGCCELKGDRCCANNYFFFTLCRQSRTYDDGFCDSNVGHWCFYVWCYPFHIICDIIMAIFSPFVFLLVFWWCVVTFFCCCCEHKEGPLVTACYITSRSLNTSLFVLCLACCGVGN